LAVLLVQQPVPNERPVRYWQQDVAYEITAKLDEPSGVLAGDQRIGYRNNSPDTLTTFSLHLYLNAFRPGSLWSAADSAEGRRRFNDLPDPEFAFNHVRNVRIMGEPVRPSYPFAPDSTVVRFTLPRPLAPGDSMSVALDWNARPSTLPRRQGRQGRRFDFAQWYPAVVVYDRHGWNEHPLRPAGEFYGEFGSFRVDLDVAADQVIGATGVPVCGDPGWEQANRDPSRPVEYQRDYYGATTPPADVCTGAAPGRKRMRWYAEKVHHFAFSLNPEYRYEGGRFKDVALHVLYQPGDETTWGNGIAIERTTRALAWLDQLFGPFGWPQFTNLHRIEGGGTEFPMVIMTGGADQGLILHEAGHNYVQGLLANNEWREGWLDEGFTTFQSTWYWELHGRPSTYPRNEANVLLLDLDGESEPPSRPAEDYRDFTSYNVAINTRGELFFHQLRYVVGDETMVRILRTYYERWKYKHVDEEALRRTAEEVSGRDLSALFAQWLHTTDLYDYAAGKVRTRQEDSVWVTEAEVLRKAPGRIPVLVAVIAEGDTAVVRAEGTAERDTVRLVTLTRPRQVIVDPIVQTHDWNMTNNYRDIGFRWSELWGAGDGTEVYFHPYFSTRSRRERLTLGIHPTVWYNEGGGVTLGLRAMSDYLGRFSQHVVQLNYSTGWDVDGAANDLDFLLRWKNPTFLRAPHMSQRLDVYHIEGRYGAAARLDWAREKPGGGPTWSKGVGLTWLEPDDFRYLDRGYYEDLGTVELELSGGVETESGVWQLGLHSTVAVGLAYDDAARDPLYARATVIGTARTSLGSRLGFGARAYLGAAGAQEAAPKQRQVYLQGADPLEQFSNPFLRSRGALLVGNDFRYHAPGGAGVRGADPRVSTSALAGLSLELEGTVLARPQARLFNRVGIALFSDLAQGLGGPVEPRLGDRLGFVGDAGIGLRVDHRIGDTRFTTRFDFPIYLSRPELAHGAEPGDEDMEFRWTFSFEPAIP
jgi:hypothetical protein